jgi:hypothetical protein
MEEKTMIHTTRKWFRTLLLTALMAALPVIASAADVRTYASGGFFLELDGVMVGPLISSEGGMPTADVVNEKLGADHVMRKHIAGLKYGDITVTFSGGMTKPLYQWIHDTLTGKFIRKNGAIIFTDLNQTEVKRLSFTNALITEIGFPILDASSKDLARFTVKISPEYTRPEKGKGGKVAFGIDKQKHISPANFRLSIPGLDTSKVNKVEALVAKLKVVENSVGETRDYLKEPAHLEIPNLVIEMSESNAQSTVDWFNDFLVKGNNGQDREKFATLEILDPTMKTALMTINLNNLGIFKLEPLKTEANKDAILRIRASMYCETMQFNYGGK